MVNRRIYKKILTNIPDVLEDFLNHYKASKFTSTCCSYKKILKHNKDVLDYVYASCNYGVSGYYKVHYKKCASFLVMADIHGCYERLKSAIYYLNKIDSLDFAVQLGDVQPSGFSDNDGVWFSRLVNKSKKPFYNVVGNHDGGHTQKTGYSGTKQQVFDKYFAPTKKAMQLPLLDKTYYSVNFDKYKITLLVLDNYLQPEDKDENGKFIFKRGSDCYNQEQIDFIIKTLSEIPNDYHLLIASHSYFEDSITIDTNFTQKDAIFNVYVTKAYEDNNVIATIVDAWINGKKLDFTVKPLEKYSNYKSINVKADFTGSQGVFVGYFTGHVHKDIVGKNAKFQNQNVFCFASAGDVYHSSNTDLPRIQGTKSADLLTVCSVDTENRLVKFVRVGSNVTTTMVERKYISIEY